MNDYISRESALKAIFDSANRILANERPENDLTIQYLIASSNAIDAVESIPAADVEPVVYCRDCKHYDDSSWWKCEFMLVPASLSEDDFCSFGERREAEE